MERVDLAAVQAPTDSESGDAQHNADIWELRARITALGAELRAARAFRDDIAAALAPGRWRGFDGPDGVDVLEVIEDIAQALNRYDQAVGQPATVDQPPGVG